MKVIECSQRGVGNKHIWSCRCPSSASEVFSLALELYGGLTWAISSLIDHWQELKRQTICRTANTTTLNYVLEEQLASLKVKVLRRSIAELGHKTQPAWPHHLNQIRSSQNKAHNSHLRYINLISLNFRVSYKINITTLIVSGRICFHIISPHRVSSYQLQSGVLFMLQGHS